MNIMYINYQTFMQAVINSTITPNMTFTKTSQKFGQWSDVRANTVYGLGFGSEIELNKVPVPCIYTNLCMPKCTTIIRENNHFL